VSSWACSCGSTFHENSEYSLACEYSRVGLASYLQPDNALTSLHGVDQHGFLTAAPAHACTLRPARPVRAIVQMPCWMPVWTQAVVHWLHVRLGDRLVRHVPARPRRRRIFAAGTRVPSPGGPRGARAHGIAASQCARLCAFRPEPTGTEPHGLSRDSARTLSRSVGRFGWRAG
jgi:hypothetical protein